MVPSPASDYPVVTTNLWAISCLATIKNVGTGTFPTAQGEGFLAISPDGTRYYFDWLVKYIAQTVRKATDAPQGVTAVKTAMTQQLNSGLPSKTGADGASSGSPIAGSSPETPSSPDAINGAALQRDEVWLLPSKVVDRFGNTVTYTYDPQKPKNLTRIDSSDGRSLTLTYMLDSAGSNEVIRTVSDGTRTWTYGYHDYSPGGNGSTVFSLDNVVLPDNSTWSFANFDGLLSAVRYINNGGCEAKPTINALDLTGTIVHPSGATGSFTLRPTTHGRSHVFRACFDLSTPPPVPRFFATEALVRKEISGAGLGTLAWSFDYGPTNESWDDCTSCVSTKTVSTADPNGDITRYTFGNWKDVNEGRLELTESGWSGGSALRSVANHYRAFGAGPYPSYVGYGDPSNMGDAGMESRLAPLDQRVTTQQGATFTWAATAFDTYAHATSVSRSSSLGYSRAETTAYDNNLAKWVLGQVRQVVDNGTGKIMVQNEYAPTTSATAPATALLSVSRFGKLQQSLSYYSDGTVNTSADGAGQTTTYSSYMRGIPQGIRHPDGTTESAVVNNLGKITSLTSEVGATTTMGYDAMGRLASISYPSGDTVAWTQSTLAFIQVQGQENDLIAGHWKQTVTTGTGKEVTYFDALWRPVNVERWDDADRSATVRMTKHQYDFAGRTTFESYPKRNYQDLSDGVSSHYDALGRLTNRSSNSELGILYESYDYSSGFKKTYTDAKGNTTYYTYQAFDQPTEDAITDITMPEGVSVSISRDLFGKTKSITRSGAGLSLTRSYVYDGYERLCKTIEPETGATVQDYDLANNVSWRASGLSLPSSSCDTTSVATAKNVSFSYDTRNRLKDTTFGDGSAAINRTYTLDGLPDTVSSNGTKWTYTYNKRRLLEGESLVYGSSTYGIGRTYDANGSLSQLRYPVDNLTVAYNPNALGEPRQVGSYVTGVTYHPSGAIAGFTYGNGIVRTLSQNVRGLPDVAVDAGVLSEKYTYDKNGNVDSITDQIAPATATRGMSYDGLNRLKTTTAPNLWGTASYGYDTLDNLISTSITGGQNARSTVHNIDYATNRLSSISNGPANFNFGYFYDSQGNIINRGAQTYQFDLANRMTAAPGRATYVYDGLGRRVSVVGTDGVNRIQVYSQAGQLLYVAPSGSAGTKYIYLHNHQIAEVK
jgi:YD repeat-containing protein